MESTRQHYFLFVTFLKLFIQVLHHTSYSDIYPLLEQLKYFQDTFPIPGSVTDQKKGYCVNCILPLAEIFSSLN